MDDEPDKITQVLDALLRIADALEDQNYLVREDMGIVSLEDLDIGGKPN